MENFNLNNKEGKKHPFVVPDDYFRELPTRISNKVLAQPRLSWSPVSVLKWALPAITLILIAMVYFTQPPVAFETDYEVILADVPQEMIIAYLDGMEIPYSDIYSFYENSDGIETEILYDEIIKYEDFNESDLLNEYDFYEEFTL